MDNTNNTIYFNFSYFALKLLGKGLYSNQWTAIAELVANGLDAQAKNVKIYISMVDKEHSTIEIFDNGTGMNYDDLANKYALIGKDKRMDNTVDEKLKEKFMGRKGIGKLAALFLSNKYYLISKTLKTTEAAWCLDASNVDDSDIPCLEKVDLNDIKIDCQKQWNAFKTGTMIRLTNVNLTNFGAKTLAAFKARLADFYLLDELGSKIEISIREKNGDKIHFEPAEKSIAFKNMYGFFSTDISKYKPLLSKTVFVKSPMDDVANKPRNIILLNDDDYVISGDDTFRTADGKNIELPYKIDGWIGMHTSISKDEAIRNDKSYLKNKAYRPTQLRLYVRKKLAVENFMSYINNTQAFGNYIEGEISFDILDNNLLEDIATSNRQGFVEDDKRIQLLIDKIKPIINALIKERVKLGADISKEEQEIREKIEAEKKKAENKLREEQERRLEAEEKRKIEQEKREKAEAETVVLKTDLKSEKKRNTFLSENLDEDQIKFAEKLHMLKINISTMSQVITKLIMLIQRNKLTKEELWNMLKTLSYMLMRMNAVLRYGVIAKFNTAEETMEGDVFEFIQEYCDTVLAKYLNISIHVTKPKEAVIRQFVPQDIVIIFDNAVNNSIKAKANNMYIVMEKDGNNGIIKIVDDGRGVGVGVQDYADLFEFGKSFTDTGTGVGLYHIKNIIENKLKGTVSINADLKDGFELRMRI